MIGVTQLSPSSPAASSTRLAAKRGASRLILTPGRSASDTHISSSMGVRTRRQAAIEGDDIEPDHTYNVAGEHYDSDGKTSEAGLSIDTEEEEDQDIVEQDAQNIFGQVEKDLQTELSADDRRQHCESELRNEANYTEMNPQQAFIQPVVEPVPTPTNNTRRRNKRRRKPPPPYAPRCTGCAVGNALASVWCCECARNLCNNCDNRLHGAKNISLDPLLRPMCSHRVELIVDGGGVALFTPLLEIAVLAAGLSTLRPLLSAAGRALNVDYFFDSVCPVVAHLRRIIFRIDHALYPVLKGPLGAWCDTEDAFIKIFVDIWVRGVLTRTDSFALLLMKTPAAIGAFVVFLAFAPLLAIPYAAVATFLRIVELIIVPNWALFRFLAFVTRFVNDLVWLPFWIAAWFCRSTILGLVMDADMAETFHRRRPIPPKTGRRLRPSTSRGLTDISAGCLTRITRIFKYFKRRARKAITSAILTSVFCAFSLRIFLLYSPRCGTGIFAAPSKVAWDVVDAIEGGEHEAQPHCVSIHQLSRKLAKRFGVEVPELEGLGKDAEILKNLQEATGNDYIDETLRNASRGIYYYISRAPMHIKMELCIIMALIFFAGVLRRVVYWADLHRRYRWIGKIASALDDDLDLDDDSSVDSDTTMEDNEVDADDMDREALDGGAELAVDLGHDNLGSSEEEAAVDVAMMECDAAQI